MSWTREELFFNGSSYFNKLIETIDRAEHSVAVECYIFEQGKVLQDLLAALERAQARGVKVRVVMDGFGSYGLATQSWNEKNIHFRVYHPFRLLQLLKFNIRDHKKVFLIDDKTAFLGSLNVFDSALRWREAGVVLEGPEVDKICLAFEMTWSSAYERNQGPRWLMSVRSARRRLQSTILFFNTPWSLRRHCNKLRRSMIRKANGRLWIASPYFIPEKRMLASLRKAANRGVDVRLLLPSQSDVPFTVWVAHYLLPKLLVADVRVFEFKPSMMHAKVWLVDEISLVGSSNLNHRSLNLDLEIDAKLLMPENRQKIVEWFEDGFEKSEELFLPAIPSNWWQRILVQILILFQEWM